MTFSYHNPWKQTFSQGSSEKLAITKGAVRSALENTPEPQTLAAIANTTDDYVLACSSSPDADSLISNLEEDLHAIYQSVVDYSSLFHSELLLVVLHHLTPLLTPSFVVAWWDIIIRPALREPKLGTPAVNHAKELVSSTVKRSDEKYIDKVRDFRRRLFDLYLLDAFNEGSGDDILEHAELDMDQRDRRTFWKTNLEEILLRFGNDKPQEFLNEVYDHFAVPSSRLQLFMLLNVYSSFSSFANTAAVIAKHPLMTRLLNSLLFDNSSTVCTAGLIVLVKVLPVLAVHARDELRAMLPILLTILARLMCWKERHLSNILLPSDEAPDLDLERELEVEANPVLHPHPKWEWNRLEMTFHATTSTPSPRTFFNILYYLYPANVLRFLQNPVEYLERNRLSSFWVEGWDQALKQDKIRFRSERLIREHICHPALIWRNAESELTELEFWARFPVPRITTEAIMLDMRNNALGVVERYSDADTAQEDSSNGSMFLADNSKDTDKPSGRITLVDKSPGKASISLQDMVDVSVALKSNFNVEIDKPVLQWPQSLFVSAAIPTSGPSVSSPSTSEAKEQEVPSHVLQAVAGLQREVLLLRNELNFELWLSRENIKHIGRLYQDRNLIKSAEVERQALYNKLRKYRAQVVRLEGELQEHKIQASSNKNKYADWNTELQKRLKELREEKKSWMSEAGQLQRAEKNNKALLDAQGKVLEEANRKVFELETQKKENQHKIDRLKDYELQIEQHVKMQRLWDEDFARFNERGEQMSIMHTHYKQLELRLESYEKTLSEMDANVRAYKRQVQTLEARLSQMRRKTDTLRHPLEQEIASISAERLALTKANQKLRDENTGLRDELDELKATLESGDKGKSTLM
ncbi:hypothetical protein AMATHDRAFT_74240 [Amanita thiersii Skay4041]|uniref:Tuberous sclerosis 1 n=1 Tax=Amanita thiersii Skay4041 TaxID=703135 RepID=A0A2A9NQR7_9AGAR|nr:hypothetical protein AMATHDRAFT_74240 [Amanita thiersii Skay4041]